MNSITAEFQQYVSIVDSAIATRDARIHELETALTKLLANVEQFGFENISIEHPMAEGVALARKALRRIPLYTGEEPLDPRRGEEPICDSE